MTLQDLKLKIEYLFRNRHYDIYCPYCSSCGETGCCSPTGCINHPKGKYCESNQGELRVVYSTFNKFYDWLYENKESKGLTAQDIYKQLDVIYDKEEDELQEYFKTLPEKQTFRETVAKFFKRR